MKITGREECVRCEAPDPDWDEDICVMCWEEYTGEQWSRTVLHGKPMELFWQWENRKRDEAIEARRMEEFNIKQMELSL